MDWLETVCGLPWTAHFHEAFISTTHRIPLKSCLTPPHSLPQPSSSWLVGPKWKAKMCVRIVRSSSTALNSLLLLLLLLLRVVMAAAAAAAAACMLKVQSKLRSIA